MKEWNDQIGSFRSSPGTWEFFSDDNFGGKSIRLAPGDYRQLGENWRSRFRRSCALSRAGGAGGAPGGPPPVAQARADRVVRVACGSKP